MEIALNHIGDRREAVARQEGGAFILYAADELWIRCEKPRDLLDQPGAATLRTLEMDEMGRPCQRQQLRATGAACVPCEGFDILGTTPEVEGDAIAG